MRNAIGIGAAGVMIAASTLVAGQKTSTGDVAKAMSGTWTVNLALTRAPAGGRRSVHGRSDPVPDGARFQRGTTTPTMPQGVRANPTNTEPTPDEGADLTPPERADRMAMRRLQEMAPVVTLTAAADRVTVEDERGEQSCASNGKGEKVATFGVYMQVTCKWDKDRLRQEYSTTRNRFVRTWSLDGAGHLVLKANMEGLNQNTPETTTIYDRS